MQTVGWLTGGVLGICLGLFIFWRALKDDYLPRDIFRVGLCGLGGAWFILWPAWGLQRPGGELLIIGWFLLVSWLGRGLFRGKLFELLDAFILGGLPVILLWLTLGRWGWEWPAGLLFPGALLPAGLLQQGLNRRYRRIGWYRSGKVGFAGLTTMGLYALVQGMLRWSWLMPVYGVFAFICFVLVYKLAKDI